MWWITNHWCTDNQSKFPFCVSPTLCILKHVIYTRISINFSKVCENYTKNHGYIGTINASHWRHLIFEYYMQLISADVIKYIHDSCTAFFYSSGFIYRYQLLQCLYSYIPTTSNHNYAFSAESLGVFHEAGQCHTCGSLDHLKSRTPFCRY